MYIYIYTFLAYIHHYIYSMYIYIYSMVTHVIFSLAQLLICSVFDHPPSLHLADARFI